MLIQSSSRIGQTNVGTLLDVTNTLASSADEIISSILLCCVCKRALDYQQTVLKGPKKEVSEIPQDQSFFASHMLSCSETLRVCVQSSQGLLLSLMHLLNSNPAHMSANFEQ